MRPEDITIEYAGARISLPELAELAKLNPELAFDMLHTWTLDLAQKANAQAVMSWRGALLSNWIALNSNTIETQRETIAYLENTLATERAERARLKPSRAEKTRAPSGSGETGPSMAARWEADYLRHYRSAEDWFWYDQQEAKRH